MTTTVSLDSLRDLAAFRAQNGCAISLYLDLDPERQPDGRRHRDTRELAARPGVEVARRDSRRPRARGAPGAEGRLRAARAVLRRGARSRRLTWAGRVRGRARQRLERAPVGVLRADAVRVADDFLLAPLVPLRRAWRTAPSSPSSTASWAACSRCGTAGSTRSSTAPRTRRVVTTREAGRSRASSATSRTSRTSTTRPSLRSSSGRSGGSTDRGS